MSDAPQGGQPVKEMVFGILSIVFSFIPVFNIIWAIIARKKAKSVAGQGGMAKAANITSLVGLIVSIVSYGYYALQIILTIVAAAAGGGSYY